MAVAAFAGAVVGSYLGYLFSMVSENDISYFVIISNLFMAVKFFLPAKPKKENLTAGTVLILVSVVPWILRNKVICRLLKRMIPKKQDSSSLNSAAILFLHIMDGICSCDCEPGRDIQMYMGTSFSCQGSALIIRA